MKVDSTSLNRFRRSRPLGVRETWMPEGVSLLVTIPFFSIESSAELSTVQARFALYMILVRFVSPSSAITFEMSIIISSLLLLLMLLLRRCHDGKILFSSLALSFKAELFIRDAPY